MWLEGVEPSIVAKMVSEQQSLLRQMVGRVLKASCPVGSNIGGTGSILSIIACQACLALSSRRTARHSNDFGNYGCIQDLELRLEFICFPLLLREHGLKGTICLEDLAQMIQTFTLVHEQLGVFNTPLLPQRAV